MTVEEKSGVFFDQSPTKQRGRDIAAREFLDAIDRLFEKRDNQLLKYGFGVVSSGPHEKLRCIDYISPDLVKDRKIIDQAVSFIHKFNSDVGFFEAPKLLDEVDPVAAKRILEQHGGDWHDAEPAKIAYLKEHYARAYLTELIRQNNESQQTRVFEVIGELEAAIDRVLAVPREQWKAEPGYQQESVGQIIADLADFREKAKARGLFTAIDAAANVFTQTKDEFVKSIGQATIAKTILWNFGPHSVHRLIFEDLDTLSNPSHYSDTSNTTQKALGKITAAISAFKKLRDLRNCYMDDPIHVTESGGEGYRTATATTNAGYIVETYKQLMHEWKKQVTPTEQAAVQEFSQLLGQLLENAKPDAQTRKIITRVQIQMADYIDWAIYETFNASTGRRMQ